MLPIGLLGQVLGYLRAVASVGLRRVPRRASLQD
jgi:hypothetical protein